MIGLIGLLVAVLLLSLVASVALVRGSRRKELTAPAPRPGIDYRPGTGDDAEVPRDTPLRTVDTVLLPGDEPAPLPAAVPLPADASPLSPDTTSVHPHAPELDVPEPTAGRFARLRARLRTPAVARLVRR